MFRFALLFSLLPGLALAESERFLPDLLQRLEDLLADADRAMYQEKRGKQKVVMGRG